MTLSLQLGGFVFYSDRVEVFRGKSAIPIVEQYLGNRFVIGYSSIDWEQNNFAYKEEMESNVSLQFYLDQVRQRFKLYGNFYLWLDLDDGILIYCDICELIKFASDLYSQSSTLEFWLFSARENCCIELYHEDVVTFGYTPWKQIELLIERRGLN